jgi:hypothetical protein
MALQQLSLVLLSSSVTEIRSSASTLEEPDAKPTRCYQLQITDLSQIFILSL